MSRSNKPSSGSGVPLVEVTPEMIEAATDAMIESGELWSPCPDRDTVRFLMTEVLSAALAASGVPDKTSKSRSKAR